MKGMMNSLLISLMRRNTTLGVLTRRLPRTTPTSGSLFNKKIGLQSSPCPNNCRNLDLIFEKQNHVAIESALLKCEQKRLQTENEELKRGLREFFQHLAASKDFETDGLLSVQKQFLNGPSGGRKKAKRRPKSCHGRILERTRN